MKIDIDELAKGYADQLGGNLRTLPEVGGHVPNFPMFGVAGKDALAKAVFLRDHPSIADADKLNFMDYINKDVFEDTNRQTLPGHLLGAGKNMYAMTRNALGYGINSLVNMSKGTKAVKDNVVTPIGEGANIVGGVLDAGKKIVVDAFKAPKGPIGPNLLTRLSSIADEARRDPSQLKKMLPEIGNSIYDTGKDFLTGNSSPGVYGLAAAAGAGGLYSLMKNKEEKKKALDKAQAAEQAKAEADAKAEAAAKAKEEDRQLVRTPTQIHIHNTPYATEQPIKYSSIKTADMVDAIASSMGRRVVDKVLNHAIDSPAPAEHHKEKEIEITSKYPAMEKLLKKKKNKEYLEKLLQE